MRKYRSPAQVQALMVAAAAAQASGATLKDAAASLGISVPYLHTLLAKVEGTTTLGNPVSRVEQHRDEIISMYRQTSEMPTAISMIAEALVIPMDQIYKLLVEAGEILPKRRQNEMDRIQLGIKIAQLYNEGKNVSEVAQETGASVPQVYKILMTSGVKLRSKRHQNSQAAAQLWREGKTVAQIAQELGVSIPNMYPLLHEAGINPREERNLGRQAEVDKIIEMYFNGPTSSKNIEKRIKEIAQMFHRRESAVWDIIKEERDRRISQGVTTVIDALYPDEGEGTVSGQDVVAELDELYPDPPEILQQIQAANQKDEDENDMSV